MPSLRRWSCVPLALALLACKPAPAPTQPDATPAEDPDPSEVDLEAASFVWTADRFADAQVLR